MTDSYEKCGGSKVWPIRGVSVPQYMCVDCGAWYMERSGVLQLMPVVGKLSDYPELEADMNHAVAKLMEVLRDD